MSGGSSRVPGPVSQARARGRWIITILIGPAIISESNPFPSLRFKSIAKMSHKFPGGSFWATPISHFYEAHLPR